MVNCMKHQSLEFFIDLTRVCNLCYSFEGVAKAWAKMEIETGNRKNDKNLTYASQNEEYVFLEISS